MTRETESNSGDAAAEGPREERQRVGLCVDCRHARRIVSAKQSVFYRCGLAGERDGFRDYPPLPVVRCVGHEPGTS